MGGPADGIQWMSDVRSLALNPSVRLPIQLATVSDLECSAPSYELQMIEHIEVPGIRQVLVTRAAFVPASGLVGSLTSLEYVLNHLYGAYKESATKSAQISSARRPT